MKSLIYLLPLEFSVRGLGKVRAGEPPLFALAEFFLDFVFNSGPSLLFLLFPGNLQTELKESELGDAEHCLDTISCAGAGIVRAAAGPHPLLPDISLYFL